MPIQAGDGGRESQGLDSQALQCTRQREVDKHLLGRGVKANWELVLELPKSNVATAERGKVWEYMSMRGKSAHASEPDLGVIPGSKATRRFVLWMTMRPLSRDRVPSLREESSLTLKALRRLKRALRSSRV
jgi:acetylornithine deacetylase/succinyl-diaminopimelate desuccinylase-like protein